MNKSLFSAVLITLLASANVASAQIQMTFSIAHPTCHGYTNGSVTVFAVGGTSPYSYIWNNGQTTQTCAGIGAGQYTVTVTDAASSTASGSIAVSEPSAVSVAITSNNVGCDGASGTLTATGFGGTAPYTYAWDGPNSSSTATVTVTAPGNYFVTVTDANLSLIHISAAKAMAGKKARIVLRIIKPIFLFGESSAAHPLLRK